MIHLLTTPPPPTLIPSPCPALATTRAYATHRTTLCYQYTIKLSASPLKHLLKPSPTRDAAEQALNDLEALVQSASDLSGRLWSRKTSLRVQGLAELKDRVFTAGSQVLRSHALHRLYDEEDDRCDGFGVAVVMHPAVVGFGSGDGGDYETGRVWMRAEVLLVEGEGEGKGEGGL